MQIQQYNICYINIIIIKDTIISIKAKKKQKPSKSITHKTMLVKMASISSSINFAKRYKYIISNNDLDKAKKLKFIKIKKYQKYIS